MITKLYTRLNEGLKDCLGEIKTTSNSEHITWEDLMDSDGELLLDSTGEQLQCKA